MEAARAVFVVGAGPDRARRRGGESPDEAGAEPDPADRKGLLAKSLAQEDLEQRVGVGDVEHVAAGIGDAAGMPAGRRDIDMAGLAPAFRVEAKEATRPAIDAVRLAAIGRDQQRAVDRRQPLRVVSLIEPGHPEAAKDRFLIGHRGDPKRTVARALAVNEFGKHPRRGDGVREAARRNGEQEHADRRGGQEPPRGHRTGARTGLSPRGYAIATISVRAAITAARRHALSTDSATASASRAISPAPRPCRAVEWSSWLTASSAPGKRWCTPKLTIAPKRAAPSELAIIRMNICEPVAAPRS